MSVRSLADSRARTLARGSKSARLHAGVRPWRRGGIWTYVPTCRHPDVGRTDVQAAGVPLRASGVPLRDREADYFGGLGPSNSPARSRAK